MKGVLLAGGSGKRLHPLTRVANKHLLPVYNKPMIYFPLQTLVRAGIRDLLLVTGDETAGDFIRVLRNGEEFGLKEIRYAYQTGSGGIADALAIAEHFADGEKIVVILGDNILEDDISPYVKRFSEQPRGGRIFFKEVEDPERFGVPEFERGRLARIVEKPQRPASRYAVVGLYMYDARVFDIVRSLNPSARGELEITDVNNRYIERGEMEYDILSGYWTDAGTFESLLKASELVAEQERSRV